MRRWVAGILAATAALIAATPGFAEDVLVRDTAVFARVFPDADGFGSISDVPPAAPAYRNGEIVGYVLFTRDVVNSIGFSAKPLDIAIGLDLEGRITGAEIVEHHEPILIIGIADAALNAFAAQYRGVDVRAVVRLDEETTAETRRFDTVSGATVSSLVINDAVLRSARAVARGRGILEGPSVALDVDTFAPADWPALIDDGSLVRLRLANAAVDEALQAKGAPGYGPEGSQRDPEAVFIDLYAALATPASIGRNLVEPRSYDRLMATLALGDQMIFVAAQGLYSFKGPEWRRSGVFDRIQIVQGEHTFVLRRDQHRPVETVAAVGAPELREAAMFVIEGSNGFDPTAPWRLDLMVEAESPEGPVYARFSLPYRLPSQLVRATAAATPVAQVLWTQVWRNQTTNIAILVVALTVLTLILAFQDSIARRRQLYFSLRYGFLVFVLVWLGWYAGAQLTVVNVITFSQALLSGFRWEIFLVAPLIFLLWSYVAVALLFWGRGVFCGWLCPFGALQELLNRGVRLLGMPQLRLPFVLHERLWMIKYVVFLALFALSFGGYDEVQPLTEVEPFKTAIVLRFARETPFVAYVLALLVAGLFIERAFCRYLCPLGAALAIPARLRMFEWLNRRWHCGSQCQICAVRCTVQAIHPDGHINPNECIHCLNCQVLFYDNHTCPPMIERRKRREARLGRKKKEPTREPAAAD